MRTDIIPQTLHTVLPVIVDTIEPTREDIELYKQSLSIIEKLQWNEKGKKELFIQGPTTYLARTIFIDVFEKRYEERRNYGIRLKENDPVLHSFYHANKLRYGTMTSVLHFAIYFSKSEELRNKGQELLQAVGTKAHYENSSFDEKIALSKQILIFSRKIVKLLLNIE